jgi:RND family efflux transporter MFP subunit
MVIVAVCRKPWRKAGQRLPFTLLLLTQDTEFMKRWMKWALAALVVALLAVSVWRALSQRKTQQEAVATQTAQRTQTVVELGSADLVPLKRLELAQGIAISGPLKAVNSAVVKARVPGELQGLTVREGESVKAGQIIARVDDSEYRSRVLQAQQLAAAAKSQIDIARRSFENNRSLVEQGFISKTALDTSLASLAAADANYRAAQAGTAVAAKSLEDTVLRAPISGLISQRLAQSGERVAVEARIVEIVDLDRLELEASLSASESLDVRLGQSAVLKIEGTAKPVSAKVVRINPSAVAGSRAVLVYLAVDATPGLRQGLFAQGTLGTGHLQTLALPLSAVRTDKPQAYVQMVSNNKVSHQNVEIGARGEMNGQTMVAVKGLSEGASVIVGSIGTLREGSTVKIIQASK